MIKVEVDLSRLEALENKLLTIGQADTLLRTVSSAIFAVMKKRIHNNGIKSDGTSIGTYSDDYLKWRSKNGYSQQGGKVLLFLTGQMQNDFSVGKLDDYSYGIGFQNKTNYLKSVNAEDGQGSHTVRAHSRKLKKPTKDGKTSINIEAYTNKGWSGYGKIYNLTETEREQMQLIVKDFVQNHLK